jgi:predicted acylesterase/phospholipase RssA
MFGDAPARHRGRLIASRFGAAAVVLAILAVTGCSGPTRMPPPPETVAARAEPSAGEVRYAIASDPSSFTNAKRDSIRRELAWRASTGQTGPLPPVSFLAISGGGDDGAFAAGLLNGWTAHGDRPEFKAVTGISTGALIAPFAFLGPRYDGVLKSLYTNISQRNIFRRRFITSALFNDALSDTTPLHQLAIRYVDRRLLDEIAAEYAKGRLLLVGTTDLDSLEPVVWNMTAIAASHDPHAIDLFRKVLIASASIPGAFPPVMIDVTVDGVHYQEMHVDGGAATQVFTYPPSLQLANEVAKLGVVRARTLYIIRNARLDPDWASVRRRTLSIAGRAIASLIHSQGLGDLYRIYVTTQRDQIDYNLAYIPPSFTTPRTKQFDTNYMRALYQTGYDLGAKGYSWSKTPPGYTNSENDLSP